MFFPMLFMLVKHIVQVVCIIDKVLNPFSKCNFSFECRIVLDFHERIGKIENSL